MRRPTGEDRRMQTVSRRLPAMRRFLQAMRESDGGEKAVLRRDSLGDEL
jgi:hypothetical protein